MPKGITWIEAELRRFFPNADLSKGVDLNRDGRLSRNELIATYNNNTIPGNDRRKIGDWADWLAFYRANASTLKKLGGIFKHSAFFKADNIIHDIIAIESRLATREQVRESYRMIGYIVAIYKMYRYRPKWNVADAAMRIRRIKGILTAFNLTVAGRLDIGRNAIGQLLTKNMVSNHPRKRSLPQCGRGICFSVSFAPSKGRLDCDTSAFMMLAAAHEMNWPISIQYMPGHVGLRWADDINFELPSMVPHFPTRASYIKKFRISKEALRQKTYLQKLTRRQILAIVFGNTALAHMKARRWRKAIDDFTASLKLYPNYIGALHNRAIAYLLTNRVRKARRDNDRLRKLSPQLGKAYFVNHWINLARERWNAARRNLSLFNYYKMPGKSVSTNIWQLRAVPQLYLDAQPRIQLGAKEISADMRVGLGARWNVVNFTPRWGLGAQVSVGYGGGVHSHTLDVLAGPSLMYEGNRFNISFDINAGYHGRLAGDMSASPVREGGIFNYGLRYNLFLGSRIGLGLSLHFQHEMNNFKRFTLIPGLEVLVDL